MAMFIVVYLRVDIPVYNGVKWFIVVKTCWYIIVCGGINWYIYGIYMVWNSHPFFIYHNKPNIYNNIREIYTNIYIYILCTVYCGINRYKSVYIGVDFRKNSLI
jgi:hypothetical protein